MKAAVLIIVLIVSISVFATVKPSPREPSIWEQIQCMFKTCPKTFPAITG